MLHILVKISTGELRDKRRFNGPPPDLTGKDLKWYPYVVETTDTSTGPDIVRETAPDVLEADRVLSVVTIRDKTQQELDDEKDERQEAALALTDTVDSLERAQFKIAFNHENRLRALEGKSAITADKFITAVKAEMGQ